MNAMPLMLLLAGLGAWSRLGITTPSQAATLTTNTTPSKISIPYVPTRHDTVRDMLWMAEVGTNDVVYDLGSGDGRVVIAAVRDFHARRAAGIELDAKLVQESRSNAVAAGVADRIEFIQGDLFAQDFSAASVVVLYLGHSPNLDLRPQLLRSLKPGARVVSHGFGMGEWIKDKAFDVRTAYLGMHSERANEFRSNPDVPDFDDRRDWIDHDMLSVWIVPARVAGVWRGKVRTEWGEQELKLILHQRLSGVDGSFQLQGPTNLAGSVGADLWGGNLRCWCIPTNAPWYPGQMWVDGQVQGDTLTGGLRRLQGTNSIESQWTARRDPADFIGSWEWRGVLKAPVQPKIERSNGRLSATYTDYNREKNAWRDDTKPIPVVDTYDFGGGFYFTLLLGVEGDGSRRTGPEDGWVVGEAVLEQGKLKGTIAFYPYNQLRMPGLDDLKPSQTSERRPTSPSGRQDWQPKRIGP